MGKAKKPWKPRPQPPIDVLVHCDRAVERLQEVVGRINSLLAPPTKDKATWRLW